MVITSLELAPSATEHHLGTSHSMACWVSRQSVPCDFCQIAFSLHLKHQMMVSSEWSKSVLPGQLVSALGAAVKSRGHAAEMYLALSLQDTSVHFPTWMSL